MNPKEYFVYILSNKSMTLYVGVTSDLAGRIQQHREKQVAGFTKKYNLTKLVFFESFQRVDDAISREKEIKGWLRQRKLDLITGLNPNWRDLSQELR